MTRISAIRREQLDALLRDSRLLERDRLGIKVVQLADGNILKLFRRKRWLNRDLLAPAAVRFARHARRLQQLGVPTVRVLELRRVVGEALTVAIYRPLPGCTLRDMLAAGAVDRELCYRVGVFMARLHRLGILFRSVHPGNIIVHEGRLGLIDVLDMRFRPGSLWRWARRRNWLHFLRCETDRPHLTPALIDELLLGYGDAADLPGNELTQVSKWIGALLR